MQGNRVCHESISRRTVVRWSLAQDYLSQYFSAFKMKCSNRDSNMILQNIESFNLFDSGDNLLFRGTIELQQKIILFTKKQIERKKV